MHPEEGTVMLIYMLFALLLSVAMPILIGVFVYKDARKRNMDAVLWTLLAVLGSYIGLIIYLVVRNKSAAPVCKEAVCPACNQSVEPGWKLCPRCGVMLPEY